MDGGMEREPGRGGDGLCTHYIMYNCDRVRVNRQTRCSGAGVGKARLLHVCVLSCTVSREVLSGGRGRLTGQVFIRLELEKSRKPSYAFTQSGHRDDTLLDI